MTSPIVVFGCPGAGSIAVESALVLAGAPHEVRDIAESELADTPNPLAQAPAILLPDGELMTESAAILLWICEAFPEARLAPLPGDARRRVFLRWMSFVSSAIYALYWIRDVPARVVDGEAGQALVKRRLGERIAHLWTVMDAEIRPDPWLTGEDISVLDLYVAAVSRWTPQEPLREAAPRVAGVAAQVESHPDLAALWRKRFPRRDVRDLPPGSGVAGGEAARTGERARSGGGAAVIRPSAGQSIR